MKSMTKVYLLLLFSCLFAFYNCNDCDSVHCFSDGFACYDKAPNSCNANCRPSIQDTERCFSCTITNEFYTININSADQTYTCDTCSETIILSSKECMAALPPSNTLHKLGDIYYKECPSYSIASGSECTCENMYYDENFNGKKKRTCLSPTSSCPNSKNFYNYESKECYSGPDCNPSDYIKKYEANGNIRCHSSCVGQEFYKKLSDNTEICLDSCDRYTFYDSSNSNKKYCKDDCLPDTFRKKNNLCYKKEECDFYDGEYCLNSCEESTGTFKHNDGSNKCIANCEEDDYLYLKNNICYKLESCNYFKEVGGIKICLSTCNVGEGYIGPNSGDKKCYSSCNEYNPSSHLYCIHGDNKCMDKCRKPGNSKIYRKEDGFECFSSCKEIDDTLLYEDSDNGANDIICKPLSDFNTNCLNVANKYYITKGDGVKKCVDAAYCSSIYYNYLKGKECIEECNDYKGIDNPASSLINCFENFDECISNGYTFYNINEKKCWKVLPDGYCKISNSAHSEIIPLGDNNIYYDDDGLCVTSCKDANKYIDIYNIKKCISECKDNSGNVIFYKPENNKCILTCSLGQGFVVGADKICYSSCPNELDKKYHNYNSNECLDSCASNTNGFKYHIDGGTVCYPSCNDIPAGPNGKYLFEIDGQVDEKICSDVIPINCQVYEIDGVVKKCKASCTKKFLKGKECSDKCDEYKANYDEAETSTSNICLTNLNECFSNNYNYYNTNSKKCWNDLPDGYYIKSENEGKFEVIQGCGDDLLELDGVTPLKCISFEDCKSLQEYKEGNKCVTSCTTAPFKYNSECFTSCLTNTGHNYYNHDTYDCLPNCSGAHLYHLENQYECFTSCNDIGSEGEYNNLRGNICSQTECPYYHTIENNVKKCYENIQECAQAGYEYLKENTNECISELECADFKIKERRNSNGDILELGKFFSNVASCKSIGYNFYNLNEKECWKDSCKEGLLTMIIDIDGNKNVYEYEYGDHSKENCVQTCPADHLPSGNYCKKKCKDDTNLFWNVNNEYECYTNCPQGKFKYQDAENNKLCLSECPSLTYHKSDSNECGDISVCDSLFADYNSRECVSRCNTAYISKKEITGKTYTICLNACNVEEYGTFISPNNECIISCSDFPFSERDSNIGFHCICKKLYYYDENQKKVCMDDTITHCYEDSNYKIQIYGTSQCVKTCQYILSLNGEICYKNVADACKEDSYLSTYNGYKCDCPYKFYMENNKKHCLEEYEQCPSGYPLYVPEKNQCVDTCPSDMNKKFRTFCLSTCPYGSSEAVGGECKCKEETGANTNLWYSTGENSFVCLGKDDLCPDKYPLLAPQTNECLKKCKGTFYPYLFDNKCYSGCSEIPNTIGETITNDLASFTCVCQYPWYYESNNEMHCPESSTNIHYCSQYTDKNLNYMIHDTKQCVEKCPSNYLYHFNQECFKKCEDADLVYNYSTKKDSYECQCKYLWYTEEKTVNTDIHIIHKKCLDSSVKDCTSITGKQFLMYDTNECVAETECSNMYVFNMICYSKCPENTKEIEKTAGDTYYKCVCNKDLDLYWYEYSKSGVDNEFYVCGVKECPINSDIQHNKPYLLKEEKQCLASCKLPDDSDKFSLRNICIDECPDYTEEEEIDDLKKCEFFDLNDEPIVDIETLKYYGNVQAKELYDKSHSLGGYLFNKFEGVSFHVYAIDKSDSLKEYATQSNLTYIDFGTCLPKLFASNILRNDDKILVVKYDLSNWNSEEDSTPAVPATPADETQKKDDKKYLINKVEYEFYNYRTMERIDASLCDPYEIIVSYPIVYNKNKFNNYDSGFNNNEYKKKFEMGKLLNLKNNEVDTFNLNDSIYKELCTGIELYGKDIVFEDRYETLYPNGALLCESNCTYNNTDFAEERVNCKCAYKDDIFFNRDEEEKNDLVNDPNFHVPTQSSSNIQVMKCLKKLKVKDAIVNNEAFYYCAAVTALVGSMTLITAFYGIKSASVSISNISPQPQNNFNAMERKVKFDNNDIKSSQRKLNNPPKKPGSNINEDDDDDNVDKGNIIEHKNIGLNYNNNNDILAESNVLNGPKINYSHKAEYLPLQYNFKFFKLNDKGVLKQIERNKLPFKVSQDTKYLLERKKGVDYPETYLNGPFYQGQNIVEIIDDGNVDNKKKNNNINNNVDIVYKSNQNLIDSNKDVNMKQRGVKNNLNLNMNMSMKNTNSNFKSGEKGEKDFITIKRLKFNKKGLDDTVDNKDDDDYGKKDEELSLYTLIKREQSLLRVSYGKYISKEHKNILAVFLAEILDKVYLVKTCLFLKKFEIFAVHFSLYLFCHLLLLTLSCAFFTTKVIKKRWKEDNYPGVQYYLLYGLITNVVVWAAYRIFLCLLDIQDKVKEYVKLKKESNKDNANDDNLEINDENAMNKLNEIIKNLKCRIIIFYCVIFVLIILFALYLIPFFSIYTGTKSCVLLAYIYGIVEILLIKFIYGVCLAAIRVSSEGNELECLYKVVYILDKYIS